MNMVRHQTVTQNLQTVLPGIAAQQVEVLKTVQVPEEDSLRSITALGDVMRDARDNGPRGSWHAETIPGGLKKSEIIGGVPGLSG